MILVVDHPQTKVASQIAIQRYCKQIKFQLSKPRFLITARFKQKSVNKFNYLNKVIFLKEDN